MDNRINYYIQKRKLNDLIDENNRYCIENEYGGLYICKHLYITFIKRIDKLMKYLNRTREYYPDEYEKYKKLQKINYNRKYRKIIRHYIFDQAMKHDMWTRDYNHNHNEYEKIVSTYL